MAKILIGLVVIVIVMVVGNIILPVPQAAIEVAAEPIGLGPVSNALFTSILLSIVLIVVAAIVGSSLKEQPTGLQNLVEVLIEGLESFITQIAPKKWVATFFPILATIFIYLLFANWLSLLTPLFGSFGIVHSTDHGGVPVETITFISGSAETMTPLHHGAYEEYGAEEESHGEAEADHAEGEAAPEGEEVHEKQAIIVPIFRAPSSDLNLTLALALMSVILTQIFGLMARGGGYIGNFIRLKGFSEKGVGLGFIDFFVGILELVSEFAKIISFSFRLFGNIFAGEVVLIVIISLVSLLLILVFFGLEIFVGFIQAFVFFILSLVFFSMATQAHGEH